VKTIFACVTGICLLPFWAGVSLAGDLACYGYTSTTSYFRCNIEPENSGNCTWWAAYKRPDLAAAGISGNADKWYVNAKNLGFEVGSEPKVGAIAVFSSPGHVAYVESVDGGSFGVSEMDAYGSPGFTPGVNYATYYSDGGDKYHRNHGTANGWTLKGFIYRKKEGRQVVSTPEVHSLFGTKGQVSWEGAERCQDASRVWLVRSEFTPYADNKDELCGSLREYFFGPRSDTGQPEPSWFEQAKQGFMRAVSDAWKDIVSETKDFFTFAQTAQAAVTYDDYERAVSVVQRAVVYTDGALELIGTENLPDVYGRSDVQLSEGSPAFSGHPDHMGETDHDGKLPDMVVNDLWLRKKTAGSESHDHDFTVTDFYSDNVEWRVQAKNQGPGTKEKDKTVTVQVYLWKVRDDGDETMLEGVGKEEINKKMEPGDTTTENKSPEDFRRLIKYPGEYLITTALLTADSFKEEDKQNNFGGPYRFTVRNLSDLVVLSVSSSDGRASYAMGETASFHASFQLGGDRLPKKAKARVAWRLAGPSFPDGKIMETDRIKSSSLEDRRGNTHGENLEGVVLDFLPGDYELQAIVNPECTIAETDCSNNTGSFRFRIEEPEPIPPTDTTPVPLPQSAELKWSSAEPIAGMVCTQLLETADPHTWNDNYLCSTRDFGLKWSAAGPIAGMACTQILETADPDTWNDNYLCVPEGSPLKLLWSSAGPIANKSCVQILETADPDTWNDNYLCHDPLDETKPTDPTPDGTDTGGGQPGGGSTDSGAGTGAAPETLPAVCGTGADMNTSGPAGSVHIWNERHQLVFNDSIGQLGFHQPVPDLDPSTAEVCFSSDETGWKEHSVACATPVSASGALSVDIPSTTPAADGTWTFAQAGKTHWVDPAAFGLTAVDGHVRYGGWRRNRAWVEQDASGRLALSVTFGYGGFWYPAGSDWHNRTVQAYWWAGQGTYPGIPGTVACDGTTGQFAARFEGVELGRTGNVLLRLDNNPTDFAWNITSQWMLLPGITFVDEPKGQRMRLDGVAPTSAPQTEAPTSGSETGNAPSDPVPPAEEPPPSNQPSPDSPSTPQPTQDAPLQTSADEEAAVSDEAAPQQDPPTVEYDRRTKTLTLTLPPGSEPTAFPGWSGPYKGKTFFYVWKEPGKKMRKIQGKASVSGDGTRLRFAVKSNARGTIGIRYKGQIIFADPDALATGSGIKRTVHVKTKQEGIALP
jgi:hypothetical protein